jgi:hypothetical protein
MALVVNSNLHVHTIGPLRTQQEYLHQYERIPSRNMESFVECVKVRGITHSPNGCANMCNVLMLTLLLGSILRGFLSFMVCVKSE